MQEIWKDIVGYESFYQVSNYGRVKALKYWSGVHHRYYDREKIMILRENERGYLKVQLRKNGKSKTYYVHRLVAEAFIPNPNNLPEVNHKNEFEKGNNKVDNLEWCSTIYNANYGTRVERIIQKISKPVICVETGTEYKNGKIASKETGINYKNINACCRGVRHRPTAGGYHWKFKDAQ